MTDLLNWADIPDDFKGTLVLGNGASIAVTGNMSYPSLFSAARNESLISDRVQKGFDYLKIDDFELVLNAIE